MLKLLHEDVQPGNGLSENVREATTAIMHNIIPTMFQAQQPWALMGSTASVLQGLPDYVPPDIDLTSTRYGAEMMAERLHDCGACVRPLAHSAAGPYTSHFAIYDVMGVKVEVMGDLVISCEDGEIRLEDHWARWSEKVRVLHFGDVHIPVVPLEWQLVANALLGRENRVHGIAEYLLREGFDRPYLEAILSDYCYGERTISWVRSEMNLN